MGGIFLSYNREDQDAARLFARGFEAEGLDVWWDVTLKSGEAYDEVTEAALRDARAVVVLWSKKSVASRWVRSEAAIGQRLGTLTPVMIETCQRPVMFELTQTADLCHWTGDTADPRWRDFVEDLRRKLGVATEGPTSVELAMATEFSLPSKPSLAVMPFASLSGGDEDHLTDGIVEEISTVLSRFSSLFVIAGQSSLSYRGSSKPARQIARELGVRYLLEGSVRRAGRRVRISAKLVDALVGEQIWAERFDDDCDELFDLQDRVANAVASTIDSTITEAEMRRAVVRPTRSQDAYELTLRANALLSRYDHASVAEALTLAEQARALDSTYAWAISIVGFCHATLALNGWTDDPGSARELALRYADEAMAGAGEDQMALTVCGATLLTVGGDLKIARQLIEHAIELNPGKAFILFWAGVLDSESGRFASGLKRLERAIRLNPRSIYRPFQLQYLATCLFGMGQHDEAAVVAGEVRRLLPDDPRPHLILAASLALAGRLADARDAATRLELLGGLEVGFRYYRDPETQRRIKAAWAVLVLPGLAPA